MPAQIVWTSYRFHFKSAIIDLEANCHRALSTANYQVSRKHLASVCTQLGIVLTCITRYIYKIALKASSKSQRVATSIPTPPPTLSPSSPNSMIPNQILQHSLPSMATSLAIPQPSPIMPQVISPLCSFKKKHFSNLVCGGLTKHCCQVNFEVMDLE